MEFGVKDTIVKPALRLEMTFYIFQPAVQVFCCRWTVFFFGAKIPDTRFGGDWCIVGEKDSYLFVELNFRFVYAYSF